MRFCCIKISCLSSDMIEPATKYQKQLICDRTQTPRPRFRFQPLIILRPPISATLQNKLIQLHCNKQVPFNPKHIVKKQIRVPKPQSVIPNNSLIRRIPEIIIFEKSRDTFVNTGDTFCPHLKFDPLDTASLGGLSLDIFREVFWCSDEGNSFKVGPCLPELNPCLEICPLEEMDTAFGDFVDEGLLNDFLRLVHE